MTPEQVLDEAVTEFLKIKEKQYGLKIPLGLGCAPPITSPFFIPFAELPARASGCKMEELLDTQLFYLPSDITYTVDVTGTGTGMLGLDFVIPTSESGAKVVIFEDIPVSPSSKASTTLSAEEIIYEVVLDTGETVEPTNVGELDASDIVSPAPVDDLATTDLTTNSINLRWTAPGDDWDTGTASEYDIRYSTEPITEENWDEAIRCEGEPIPQPAGILPLRV